MEWYHIVIIIILSIIFIVLTTSYICFRLAFYSRNKKSKNKDEIIIPDDDLFQAHKNIIYNDVTYVRSLDSKEFTIKSYDGLTLKGKYYECIKGAPIEIMFHGYRGNGERDLSTGVKRAFRCNRNALIVDQRASGNSDGHVITFGIKERHDCVSWTNFVVKEFGDNVKIILTGISMGAATVLMASSMNLPKNVLGVLSDCGYNKPNDIIKKVVKEMKLPVNIFYPFIKLGAKIFGNFNLEEFSPYESVKKTKLPIIFIHGGEDSLVPHEMSKKLYDACASTKSLVTIEKAEHGVSYLVDPEKYVNELNNFFSFIK